MRSRARLAEGRPPRGPAAGVGLGFAEVRVGRLAGSDGHGRLAWEARRGIKQRHASRCTWQRIGRLYRFVLPPHHRAGASRWASWVCGRTRHHLNALSLHRPLPQGKNRPLDEDELEFVDAIAQQEAEALQREMKALEDERAGLLRDVALRQEMEAQYAKRGTLQVGHAALLLHPLSGMTMVRRESVAACAPMGCC